MTRCLPTSLFALLLTATLAAPAHGQSLAQRASNSARRLQLYAAHQGRLERQLGEQTKRIARLKKQPSGVGRDMQLKAALRSSQRLASRLTKLQQRLGTLRDKLASIYKQAVAQATDAKAKAAWRSKLRALRAARPRGASRLVTGAKANPLDSAEDLEEKADLLKDSERKVRRRLARLQRRIARLARRVKLRRHGRAATASPFVEANTRRLGGARRSGKTAGPQEARDDGAKEGTTGPSAGTPPPSSWNNGDADSLSAGKTPGGGGGDPNYSASGGSTPTTPVAPAVTPITPSTLNRGLDPATLRALKASRKGSLASRLAALKRARRSLNKLAKTLRDRSAQLRKQARKRKPRKK